MKRALAFAAVTSLVGALVAARPSTLRATKTVGNQARAERHRFVDATPELRGPRMCGEPVEPDDDRPCVGVARTGFAPREVLHE
jgi:hypothetical protein